MSDFLQQSRLRSVSRAERKNGAMTSLIAAEEAQGLDYSRFEEQPPKHAGHCSPYEKTLPEVIRMACRAAGVGAETRFLDVGCGKGFCLSLVAKEFRPARIAGVEINGAWAAVARQNLSRDGVKAEVYTSDILRFGHLADFNCFYLFNPFDRETITHFMNLLHDSLLASPGKVQLLYNNPVFHDVVLPYSERFSYVEYDDGTMTHCVSLYHLSPR